MPLYICNDPYGWGTAVENDLYTLVGQDSQHFGDNNTGQTADCVSGLVQIQYSNPLPQTAGQVLISNLCTKTPQTSIIVYGVDPTWPIPNTPFHIYDKAGWTVEPSAPGAPIKIIYDASNGFGGGYTVFDAAGNHIAFPTFLILAHELFHAWHLATKTEVADAETQAINDENTIRAQFNCTQRDPKNHNGCCGGAWQDPQTGIVYPFIPACYPPPNVGPCPGAGGGSASSGCLIVTAAYGTPHAIEIGRFEYLRDRFARRSTLAARVIAQLSSEYYTFSPRIARDMDDSEGLRVAIRTLMVQPLLDYFDLAGQYVTYGWHDPDFFIERVDQAHRHLLERDHVLGPAPEVAAWVRTEIGAIMSGTATHDSVSSDYLPWTGRARQPEVELARTYLANAALGSVLSETMSWALIAPVLAYWSLITILSQGDDFTHGSTRDDLLNCFDQWLSSVPIPDAFALMSREAAARELNELRESFWTPERARAHVATRLLQSFRSRVDYDLEALLRGLGYLSRVQGLENG